MPRRKPIFSAGKAYHIYNRGVDRQCICRQPSDFAHLLGILLKNAQDTGVRILSWILLPNHFHLLIEQLSTTPIGFLMQRVFTSYTRYFNRKYGRQGHLFEANFQSKEIDTEEYMTAVTAYIKNNAVKHGLISEGETWPFSSQSVLPDDFKEMVLNDNDDELHIIHSKYHRKSKAA